MTPELADALIECAHRGAVNLVAEAQDRLLKLDKWGEEAILYPPLHNFSQKRRSPELTEAKYRAKLHRRIVEATEVGKFCEDIRERQANGLIIDFAEFLNQRRREETSTKRK